MSAGYTGSMWPELKGGEVLIPEAKSYSELKPGDRVLRFDARRNRILTHVAVCRWGRGWVTRGINCRRQDDGLMGPESYLGIWRIAGYPIPGPTPYDPGLIVQPEAAP